jgi:hypothetical protein
MVHPLEKGSGERGLTILQRETPGQPETLWLGGWALNGGLSEAERA